MTELSIFIDESGDAGPVSRYYIVTLVFHEQAIELNANIAHTSATLKTASSILCHFILGLFSLVTMIINGSTFATERNSSAYSASL